MKAIDRRLFLALAAAAPVAAAIPAAAILPSSGHAFAAGELSPVLYVNRTVHLWLRLHPAQVALDWQSIAEMARAAPAIVHHQG